MKQRKSSRKSGESERGLQNEEISSNECAVCLRAYEDDLDANGQPLYEWVQCTSEKCGKWMHQDCLDWMICCMYVVYVKTFFNRVVLLY